MNAAVGVEPATRELAAALKSMATSKALGLDYFLAELSTINLDERAPEPGLVLSHHPPLRERGSRTLEVNLCYHQGVAKI